MISKEEFKLECLKCASILLNSIKTGITNEVFNLSESLYQEGLKRNFLQIETDNRTFDKDGKKGICFYF